MTSILYLLIWFNFPGEHPASQQLSGSLEDVCWKQLAHPTSTALFEIKIVEEPHRYARARPIRCRSRDAQQVEYLDEKILNGKPEANR